MAIPSELFGRLEAAFTLLKGYTAVLSTCVAATTEGPTKYS